MMFFLCTFNFLLTFLINNVQVWGLILAFRAFPFPFIELFQELNIHLFNCFRNWAWNVARIIQFIFNNLSILYVNVSFTMFCENLFPSGVLESFPLGDNSTSYLHHFPVKPTIFWVSIHTTPRQSQDCDPITWFHLMAHFLCGLSKHACWITLQQSFDYCCLFPVFAQTTQQVLSVTTDFGCCYKCYL